MNLKQDFNFDINQVANNMFQAVGKSLAQDIPQSIQFGTDAFAKFITHIEQIQTDAEQGKIPDDVAQDLVDDRKLTLAIAAQTELGLAKITAQNAINAAIDVLNTALQAALGMAFANLKFTLV